MRRREMLNGAVLCLLAAAAAVTMTAQTVQNTQLYPANPLDTIPTAIRNVSVITYSNNTFRYYFPDSSYFEDNEFISENWQTDKLSAYARDVKQLPDEMELRLIDTFEDFCVPLVGSVYSKYGYRRGRAHTGCDIPTKKGTPIRCAFTGKVRYASYNSGGYGNLVIVRHLNGLETYYGHLTAMNVEAGDYVAAGQVIGYAGSTGRSSSTHLHFETRYRGMTFDPERIIDFEEGYLRFQTFAIEKSFFNTNSKATEMLEDYDDDESVLPVMDEEEDAASEDAAAQEEPVQAEEYYTIRKGDTLGAIARRNGITLTQLCRLNGIKSTTRIYPGRKLRVK